MKLLTMAALGMMLGAITVVGLDLALSDAGACYEYRLDGSAVRCGKGDL